MIVIYKIYYLSLFSGSKKAPFRNRKGTHTPNIKKFPQSINIAAMA